MGKKVMWEFRGKINFECKECNADSIVDIRDFDVDHICSDERQMGSENTYELYLDHSCNECQRDIFFKFHVYEYPEGSINYVEKLHEGVHSTDDPILEFLENYYEIEENEELESEIREIIKKIKKDPKEIRELNPRQFEELVAELFKEKGFEVELTKRTRDGGKDIIAISKDAFGGTLKYFIECKHYAENNKISVELVRNLYGVKHTKDGPNKVMLVTTSSFTSSAINFAEKEAHSSWDITLADFDEIINWVNAYNFNSSPI